MKIKKTNSIALTKEDFSFVCPLKTEDMSAVDDGYFCGKCEKKVHDVTEYSPEAFHTLKEKSDNLCITFKKVAAVSLVLGLSACSGTQQRPLTGKIATPSTSCDTNITSPNPNRLAPFKNVDKNKTIYIEQVVEPQLSGMTAIPEFQEKDVPKVVQDKK